MKQVRNNKRERIENPVWCDHCRVRIAPYEKIATTDSKSFHVHCFQKERITKSQDGLRENPGLSFAVA
jgi:hypothetical protein